MTLVVLWQSQLSTGQLLVLRKLLTKELNMIEVHPNPAKALSDGPQSLTPERFDHLMQELAVIGKAVRRWPEPSVALAF